MKAQRQNEYLLLRFVNALAFIFLASNFAFAYSIQINE